MTLTLPTTLATAVTLVLIVAVAVEPGAALADRDFPDFYGTIVAADRERGTVTIATDTDEMITVDVGDLGTKPFDEGAFAVDSVVVLRTMRVGDRFVAIGWEQARSGREQFRGR